MYVKQIVIKYLKKNGFDGLYGRYDNAWCGCSLNDFMPCMRCGADCRPAYKHSNGNMHSMKESDFLELQKREVLK